ncbi:MAG: FAD-dependent oxidoreductase [Acidimicrobiia bacterium]
MTDVHDALVIGGGVTGVAAGLRSGAPVLEQTDGPGGICRSYYMVPGSTEILDTEPADRTAYRFEVGGGHWIFGGMPEVLSELASYCDFRTHRRVATVHLGASGITVPYPLQAHVAHLDPQTRGRAEAELAAVAGPDVDAAPTLEEWLVRSFGPTLFERFFGPFHDRYTAGLTARIAPQDTYKSPGTDRRGYNSTFRYPVDGLDRLADRIAQRCDVRYGHQVVGIDPDTRTVALTDGSEIGYRRLLSTLPLDRALTMAGITVDEAPDPSTSVLVLNVGGERGDACPDCHWQYEPDSRAGFHRIGFYSNVDADFLPADRHNTHVSMYVERAYRRGAPPTLDETTRYTEAVLSELRDRDYLRSVEVAHPSWVEVAYTWRTPGSLWRESALKALEEAGIHQIGRYGRWQFQGIADSIAEGFEAGEAVGLHG